MVVFLASSTLYLLLYQSYFQFPVKNIMRTIGDISLLATALVVFQLLSLLASALVVFQLLSLLASALVVFQLLSLI